VKELNLAPGDSVKVTVQNPKTTGQLTLGTVLPSINTSVLVVFYEPLSVQSRGAVAGMEWEARAGMGCELLKKLSASTFPDVYNILDLPVEKIESAYACEKQGVKLFVRLNVLQPDLPADGE